MIIFVLLRRQSQFPFFRARCPGRARMPPHPMARLRHACAAGLANDAFTQLYHTILYYVVSYSIICSCCSLSIILYLVFRLYFMLFVLYHIKLYYIPLAIVTRAIQHKEGFEVVQHGKLLNNASTVIVNSFIRSQKKYNIT